MDVMQSPQKRRRIDSPSKKRKREENDHMNNSIKKIKMTMTQEIYYTLEDLKEMESDYDPMIYYGNKGNICPYA